MTDVDLRSFIGRTVRGEYRLDEYVGGGGFGGVFVAEQLVLGLPIRNVAVKVSLSGNMSEQNVRDVLADAFVLAGAMESITDAEAARHLVHVYSAGLAPELGDRWFLAMELVRGTTLEQEFASHGKVAAPLLVKWVTQMCVALRHLHHLGRPIVHRDLKPSNVLLGADNVIRLVDFGLSARMRSLGGVPGVAGTLDYMAPETSQGKSLPASDVYTAGLLMYEGLTGRRPFAALVPPADVPEALHGQWVYERKRVCPVLPPSVLNNTVTSELDAIVLRCLEFEPASRFADAGDLLAELTGSQPADAVRRSKEVADRRGGLRVLDEALRRTQKKDEQVRLLREKGEVLGELGEHVDAAGAYVRAWQLVEHSGVLPTTEDRVALLTRIVESYRLAGNRFQENRWRRTRAAEDAR